MTIDQYKHQKFTSTNQYPTPTDAFFLKNRYTSLTLFLKNVQNINLARFAVRINFKLSA